MSIPLILEFVVALALLILIHEFGHFLAARLLKVDVEEFGIGFPPRALTLFTSKGTRFSLNWLPFGGFVRLKGENDPSIPGSFANAKPWVRITILLAGPMANLLTGVLMYTAIFLYTGVPDFDRVQIVNIAEQSPAAEAGLLAGDIVLAVNGEEINSTDELSALLRNSVDQSITITIERDGQVSEVSATPLSSRSAEEGALGVMISNPLRRDGALMAFPAGILAVGLHSQEMFGFVGKLVQGDISPQEGRLVGYKGMYDLYEQARESDPAQGVPSTVITLGFFTSITISLGLLNLLPIPALDGGRIMFIIPEIILHRRVPQNYESIVHLVSFGLLLLLMIYINLQDFINPVQIGP